MTHIPAKFFSYDSDSEESNSSFSFVVKGSALESNLAQSMSAASCDSTTTLRYFVIAVYDKLLFLISITNETYCEMVVTEATHVTGSGYVCILPDILKGLVKKRAELKFEYKGSQEKNTLTFRSKGSSYKADIPVIDLDKHIKLLIQDKIKCFETESNEQNTLSKSLYTNMIRGVKLTSIKNIYNTNTAIRTFARLDEKQRLLVYSYDSWHMVMHVSKDTVDSEANTQPFSVSFAPSVFDVIDKTIGKSNKTDSNIDMCLSESYLALSSATSRAVFPYAQASETDFIAPIRLMKSLKHSLLSFDFGENLVSSVDSLSSLFTSKEVKCNLEYISSETKVVLSIKTGQGDAYENIAVTNIQIDERLDTLENQTLQVSFDPGMFRDLIRNVSKYLGTNTPSVLGTMSIYDSCFYIRTVSGNSELRMIGSLHANNAVSME